MTVITTTNNLPIITIDGSSGSGKGTLTTRLAHALNYHMLDSGALYRIVGFMANRQHLLDNLDENLLAELTSSLNIQFLPAKPNSDHMTTLVNGEDISEIIRTEQVGEMASKVAIFPKVRQALLQLQQNMANPMYNNKQGLVADGRDMGTVVFPTANLKIYLTASAQARANRRLQQLQNAGQVVDYDKILQQIIERDERDNNRATAPAKPADDAIIIDSSMMNAQQVFDQVWQLCQQRGLII